MMGRKGTRKTYVGMERWWRRQINVRINEETENMCENIEMKEQEINVRMERWTRRRKINIRMER